MKTAWDKMSFQIKFRRTTAEFSGCEAFTDILCFQETLIWSRVCSWENCVTRRNKLWALSVECVVLF